MRVVMVGCGYVGIVSGACFSEFGCNVTCVDTDFDKINQLNKGLIPIYEPGLDSLVKKNIKEGRLSFSDALSEAVPNADLVFIAVGTPSRRGDGYADLSYVYDAAKQIAQHLKGYTVIVNKSTVPVGTAEQVKRVVHQANPNAEFDIASNPEFLREGSAINDFLRPDRVVLGVENERAEKMLRALYRPLNLNETPIVASNFATAELSKYAANAFLATKISFINEMSLLCEEVGADVHGVAKSLGLDGRIGPKFLHPGPGYGGSCLPKDTVALTRTAQQSGISLRIVEATIEANAAQKTRMVSKVENALDNDLSNKTIAVLGLTYKPETDDLRDAPSLSILPALLEKGASLKAFDPQGMEAAAHLIEGDLSFYKDIKSAITGADALVILTEWNEFRALDLAQLKKLMTGDTFVDLRNIYERDQVEALGFRYHCVGR